MITFSVATGFTVVDVDIVVPFKPEMVVEVEVLVVEVEVPALARTSVHKNAIKQTLRRIIGCIDLAAW